MREFLKSHPQSAIRDEIALLRTNEIAGNPNDFKMHKISCLLLHECNELGQKVGFF
jgi:hypothetical protein